MKKIFIVASLFSLALISSCQEEEKPPVVTNFPVVERVFMHDPGNYSIMYKDKKTQELISYRPCFRCEHKLYEDVPNDSTMWASLKKVEGISQHKSLFEIHVHSSKEVNGAGWNHGKHGSGQTTPIE